MYGVTSISARAAMPAALAISGGDPNRICGNLTCVDIVHFAGTFGESQQKQRRELSRPLVARDGFVAGRGRTGNWLFQLVQGVRVDVAGFSYLPVLVQ